MVERQKVELETNNQTKTNTTLKDEYYLRCSQAAEELDSLYKSELSDDMKEALADAELRNLMKTLGFMGQDVAVLVPFYLANFDENYSMHRETRVTVGRAVSVRYDPGIVIGDENWASSLSLQLVVEDNKGLRRLLPLSIPHEIVPLSPN